jgi:hypothetical protein
VYSTNFIHGRSYEIVCELLSKEFSHSMDLSYKKTSLATLL